MNRVKVVSRKFERHRTAIYRAQDLRRLRRNRMRNEALMRAGREAGMAWQLKLNDMTVKELRAQAKEMAISGSSKMNKQALLSALKGR